MRHSIVTALATAGLLLSGCSTPSAPPINNYLMGEKVLLGRLSYTVFETQWLTHLGEGPSARVPQHRFFLVRFSAVNGGSNEANVANTTVVNDKGEVFEELSSGEGVPQWAGYLRLLKPADTLQGNMVFDAPPGHYKIKVSDENGTQFALIDLPLTFGAETPDVVAPGEKKK
jgi:hypothetical protein